MNTNIRNQLLRPLRSLSILGLGACCLLAAACGPDADNIDNTRAPVYLQASVNGETLIFADIDREEPLTSDNANFQFVNQPKVNNDTFPIDLENGLADIVVDRMEIVYTDLSSFGGEDLFLRPEVFPVSVIIPVDSALSVPLPVVTQDMKLNPLFETMQVPAPENIPQEERNFRRVRADVQFFARTQAGESLTAQTSLQIVFGDSGD